MSGNFWRSKNNILVLLCGSGIALIASILIFQMFLKMNAEELITSWLKAEAVNIQQDNLLSSVTKAQSLVLAGNFVIGIDLKKKEEQKQIDLIQFGSNNDDVIIDTTVPGVIYWKRSGFATLLAQYRFPTHPEIEIRFIFFSSKALVLLWSYISIILLLLIFYGLLISKIAKDESIERELILKHAIEQLIGNQVIPDILRIKVPSLISHWESFKEMLRVQREHEAKAEAAVAIEKVVKQVAHDIRSPLSALNMAIHGILDVPIEKSNLIKSAIQRINDISNDLLRKSIVKVDTSAVVGEIRSLILITSVVDSMVSEKRTQYRDKINVIIEIDLQGSFGAFVKLDRSAFERVLSNLINNSVESLVGEKGEVIISVRSYTDKILIIVSDNGRGIPKQILNKLGTAGLNFEKSSGTGLGVFHAKETVEKFGGNLVFRSIEGSGTMAEIQLPKAGCPSWFAEELKLTGNTSVVVLDDDVSIHEIWTNRFRILTNDKNLNINLIHFSSIAEFQKLVLTDNMLFLIDYEYSGLSKKSGVDLILERGIASRSVLVTSHFENLKIQQICDEWKIKILPKQLAELIPFQVY